MILGMLGGMRPAPDGPLGVIRAHRHIEAARLAYRDRDAFLADPAQVDVPVKKLLSPEYLGGAARADPRRRGDARTMPAAGEALLPPHRDTVYLCVVDRDGNACSFINSLFEGFGCGILARAVRRHAAEPRLRLPAASAAIPTASPRASGRCTPSFPAC